METLPRDPKYLITSNLKFADLLSYCSTHRDACPDSFWEFKLKQDFPNVELDPTQSLKINYVALYRNRELNKLKDIIGWKGSIDQLYRTKTLDLYKKGLTEIPESIEILIHLQKLVLGGNKIERIPDTLPDSLQGLYLSDNKIEKIPDTLPESLKYLFLVNNKIEKIPDTLPNTLQQLWLSNNKIERIPDNLPNSLTQLHLYNNKIEKIPDTLPNSLKELTLMNNKIKRENVDKIKQKYPNLQVYIK